MENFYVRSVFKLPLLVLKHSRTQSWEYFLAIIMTVKSLELKVRTLVALN